MPQNLASDIFGNRASEIMFDISETGLDFLPGDRAAIYPENSRPEVLAFLQKNRLNGEAIFDLSPTWIDYFEKEFNLALKSCRLEFFTKIHRS